MANEVSPEPTSVVMYLSAMVGYLYPCPQEALINVNDLVIGISTSGNSKNVVNAMKYANEVGVKAVGFSGGDGGEMNSNCYINLVIPSYDTPRIQEMHILVGHILCHLIDLHFSQ